MTQANVQAKSQPAASFEGLGPLPDFSEAPVVVFSMTSSDSEHLPRGVKFVFSKNRLNVALSRARCLAYLVCTEELLNTRVRNLDDMKLVSTLCAFVEEAERQQLTNLAKDV